MQTDAYTECLQLTKAMQKTSETMQGVADLYDDHVSQPLRALRGCGAWHAADDLNGLGEAHPADHARRPEVGRAPGGGVCGAFVRLFLHCLSC